LLLLLLEVAAFLPSALACHLSAAGHYMPAFACPLSLQVRTGRRRRVGACLRHPCLRPGHPTGVPRDPAGHHPWVGDGPNCGRQQMASPSKCNSPGPGGHLAGIDGAHLPSPSPPPPA
jgi:hypothetical protein